VECPRRLFVRDQGDPYSHFRIGLNCGPYVFGQGFRANATIGRAVRLVLMNIGQGIPGKTDRATHGHPGKFTYCGAENEEESPWEPYHVERGWAPTDSTVMVHAAEAPHNVNDHTSLRGRDLLMTVADTMNTVGTNNVYLSGEMAVVFSPEIAQMLAADGMSNLDVRHELYRLLRLNLNRISPTNRERFRLIRSAFDVAEGVTEIPYLDDPEQILALVAGGAGRHALVTPSFGISNSTMDRV